MAFYQGGFAPDPRDLGLHVHNTNKIIRRALKSAKTKLYDLVVTVKTPNPTLCKKVQADYFAQCAIKREKIQELNKAWIFTSNTPTKPFDVDINRAILDGVHNSRPTRIGFPPVIPAPGKHSIRMFEKSGQDFPDKTSSRKMM